MNVLTVNAGSSSLRLAVYETVRSAVEPRRSQHFADEPAVGALERFLGDRGSLQIDAVAHRIVHGGPRLTSARVIDAGVEEELATLDDLAPLHNPIARACIGVCRRLLGDRIPQVACFDTAFFAHLPLHASAYALPADLCRRYGVRRYGFHGLAHEDMWTAWDKAASRGGSGRVISLQLGSGCSASAVIDGRPIDTSMGFSPLEGLVMATRCGDVDPAAIFYLQRKEQLSSDGAERLLEERSGLLGLAGTRDMRALLARRDEAAHLAFEVYCYRAKKYVGAYLAALGGADAVLFGGGVGENAPVVRAAILDGLTVLGVRLDPDANVRAAAASEPVRIDARSPIAVWVIPVDETRVLLRESLNALHRVPSSA